ncbi:trypsin-like peptidase domain-containing protein [Thalassotalea aquiviva]|uniref:trypsin-like peptidase domain-containing protein n=1 Tax=Thalassotalea aquiviva TaxID=3242415 RepID=UPI00352B869C
MRLDLKMFRQILSSYLLMLLIAGCTTTAKSEESSWNKTVKRVSSGIVSIQSDVPVSFDGNWNRSSYATGFVVDAKRGIILTNRHVVTPGPITAKAITVNNEEVDLTPLYIDPVHDFGFFSYDPSQVKHLDVHEFKLNPASTHVGQDIRIIGNDAGQKLSILDGTISRLDRDAPEYGKGKYNDFNTYYIQAATSSTGGSSGSPVINIKGEAVALNAGSQTKSANAFFLPLHFVQEALNKLQQSKDIARGSIQTTFKSTPYAELKRLGLTDQLETEYRNKYQNLKGLLVIESIIPQSSAADVLAIGDILLSINQQSVVDFIALETQLNAHVNQSIEAEILRAGQSLTVRLTVNDLQQLSPAAYLEFDGSIYHTLSYQQARHFNKPVQGVYVAFAGAALQRAGINNHNVLTSINGVAIENINDYVKVLNATPDGTKVHVRYVTLQNPTKSNYGLMEVNRNWFVQKFCQQNQKLGYWPCQPLPSPEPVKQTVTAKLQNVVNKQIDDPFTQITKALVRVNYTSPYSIQGRSNNRMGYGTGVIVDAEKGLVVVDKTIVVSMLGDVKLVFDNQLEITGKVEYVHPIHNLALISYPVHELGNEIEVSEVTFTNKRLTKEDEVLQIGINFEGEIEYRRTSVDTIQELWLQDYNVPQYLQTNMEGIHLVNANNSIDGILVNSNNEVAALWASFEQSESNGKGVSSFLAGIHGEYVNELIALAKGEHELYSLEVGLTQIPPVYALQQGVPKAWIDKVQQASTGNKKLLAIYNVFADSDSDNIFQRGDVLLAINDVAVSTFRQVERLTQIPEVEVTYAREGKLYTNKVKTSKLMGQDIEQVFFWSGLYLHAPHRGAQRRGMSKEGVYVASYNFGSPATRYSVFAMRRITEIDGQPIQSTRDLVNAVKGKEHGESVLLKTLDFNNNTSVIALRVDNHYWPFYEVKYQDGQWQTIDHSSTP